MANLLGALPAQNPAVAGLLGSLGQVSPVQQALMQQAQGQVRNPGPGLQAPPSMPIPQMPVVTPQAPQAQARPPAQDEVTQQALTGQPIAGLSKEQQKQVSRQARLYAGLQMMMASTPQRGDINAPNFGTVLAQGIMAGQQAAAAKKGELQQLNIAQARANQYMSIFGDGPITMDTIDKAIKAATIGGDKDTLAVLKDIRGQFPERPDDAERTVFEHSSGQLMKKDRFGNVFDLSDNPVEVSPIKDLKEDTQALDVGDAWAIVDMQTSQEIGRVPKGVDPAAVQTNVNQMFERTDKLADDFRTETRQLQDALVMGSTATQAPANAAGDQTMVIAFNKLLDPNSVVREGEFDRVAQVGGFSAQAQGFANRIMSDGRLSDQSRRQLQAEIARMLGVRQEEMQDIAGTYRQRARTFGVNPDYVVRPQLGQPRSQEGGEAEEEDPLNRIRNFGGGR